MDKILRQIGSVIAPRITGTDGQDTPFVERWNTGFPDDEFIENCDIAEGKPVMNLYASSQNYNRNWALVKTEKDIRATEVIHEGGSILQYELTGDHRGNNEYILGIVDGGDPGAATYTLSNDGGENWTEVDTVPSDGEIAIGDGTILKFTGPGQFVANDTYSWRTISMQINTIRTHRFSGRLNIEMITAGEGELESYYDQLMALLSSESAFNNNGSLIGFAVANTFTPVKDSRVSRYRASVSIDIDGALYRTRQIPLAGIVDVKIS